MFYVTPPPRSNRVKVTRLNNGRSRSTNGRLISTNQSLISTNGRLIYTNGRLKFTNGRIISTRLSSGRLIKTIKQNTDTVNIQPS